MSCVEESLIYMLSPTAAWGKSILVFYGSAPWTFVLAPLLLGLLSGLGVAMRGRGARPAEWYADAIRFLLYFAAAAELMMLTMSIAGYYASLWRGVYYFSACLVILFVDGVALAAVVAALGLRKTASRGGEGLAGILSRPQIMWAARIVVASMYFMAGALKFGWRDHLAFFHASDYSTAFWYFIAVWEVVWGLAVLVRRALYFALAALGVEMLGGVYTVYHDHFVHGVAKPFLISVDPLRMFVLFVVIAYFTWRADHRPAGQMG